MERRQRIAELAAVVGDDGTGDLGVIVDSADADATTAELADIVREAREENAGSCAGGGLTWQR